MTKLRNGSTRAKRRSPDPPDELPAGVDARLRQVEERFRLFMENVREYAIFMMDPSGHVVDWNAGAEHVLGYGDEILGQPFSIFFPPDDQRDGVPDRELKRAAETGQSSDDRWHVRKNGSFFWALGITTAMRDEQGALKGYAKVLRDSTERKRFEEQLQEKNRALEQADQLKDEFLAMLAHELRNPLAPLFNAVSLLAHEKIESATGQEARSIIERQARSLARLVDDLLDVSRVSKGKIELRRTTVDLNAIIEHAVQASRPSFALRNHQFTLSLPDESLWLDADAMRIEQVVTNLLNNALRYTPDGGSITLSACAESGRAVVRVADTGIGMPSELLPRVFDLFVQGDQTLGRAQGGLGVGLTLVQKLVAMHGGAVQAASAGIGEGSQFTVILPLQIERPPAETEGEPHAPRVAARPLRVLVVDDNGDAAESLAMVIALRGHDVRTARSATEALQIACEHSPEVMLLDIAMPGMNGYQLAERLSQLPELAETVLVATTGYGLEQVGQGGSPTKFARFLTKPIEPSTLDELFASIADAKQR